MIADRNSTPLAPRFIRAVRRRIFAVRLIESVGLASAVASAAGLALMPIAWWRGQSGIVLSFASLALGAFCGLVWGVSRRPSDLDAAAEADRQLHLHDLLATVLYLRGRAIDDPWQQLVYAMADSRCRNLRPSAVVAAKLNLRAWSGVGIAAALLLSLGLLITHPIDSQAQAALAPAADKIVAAAPDVSPSEIANHLNDKSPASGRPAGSDELQEDSARNFATDRPADSSQNSAAGSSADSANSNASASSGQGAGRSTSHSNSEFELPLATAGGNSPESASGLSGAGSGQADKSSGRTGRDFNGTVAPNAAGSHAAPPWKSRQWAADSSAVESAVENGQVPSDDADLVRDYFQRD